MRLFINSLAASAGGGLTYIRNVLPLLAQEPGLQLTVAISPGLRQEFQGLPTVEFAESTGSTARRFWQEQFRLPNLIRKSGSHVLLSPGNFALRRSTVPQILLSRNSIYCSRDYYSDLITRGEYRLWAETRVRALLAKRSIQWADVTVAPSQAFADELHRWTGEPIRTIHHGFNHESFSRNAAPLNSDIEEKLAREEGALRLLFVSHYNYYRNFETLIRALPRICQSVKNKPVRLFLTCKFASGANPGSYDPQSIASLIKETGVGDQVIELGTVPYSQLHHLYRQCHVYVTPAYAETFAHPLVEAMASGLPIAASDIAVHREICRNAAVYFERFSPEMLARCVAEVADSKPLAERMSRAGRKRSRQFSWQVHVDELLNLARSLVA